MRWMIRWGMTAWLAFGSPAFASSMVAVDVQEQALDSTAVLLARVGSSDPVLTPDRGYLDTQLQVVQTLAGKAPDQLVVRQVGGVHNGRTLHVAGDGRLPAGGLVVVFVRKVGGRWYLTAMAQSVWHLETPEEQATVHRDIEGLGLLERASDGTVTPATVSVPEFETYGELVRAVRGLRMGQP